MKAMVKGTKSNGETFEYVLDGIINVTYTNGAMVIVVNTGDGIRTYEYASAMTAGYQYTITII